MAFPTTPLRYALFRQDVSRLATWAVASGTEDPEYPATKLNGRDPTDPAKLLTPSGIWRGDLSAYAGSHELVGAALIHTNLQPGLNVRLQGSASPTFATVDADIPITIPALKNNWPVNPFVLFDPEDWPYWQINVVGTNPVTVSIGHVALLTGIQTIDALQALRWRDEIPVWDDVTELDVPMDLDLLTQLRFCQFDTFNINSRQAALDDWWFDARGKILPFVFIPDVAVNECYYMTFVEQTKEVLYKSDTPSGSSIRSLQVKLKEFGRGMLPTPWLT